MVLIDATRNIPKLRVLVKKRDLTGKFREYFTQKTSNDFCVKYSCPKLRTVAGEN